MAIQPFLAMTAAEIHGSSSLPAKIGWMACHFSPYSLGLSNLPTKLPEGSLLILNDVIPIHGHDPNLIASQLRNVADTFACHGVLLDFQRPEYEESAVLAAYLTEALPCPVAVSKCYGNSLDCPVFLPPLPHHIPLKECLEPWKGRRIWLELALDAEEIMLTEAGATFRPLPCSDIDAGHEDAGLHCHYRMDTAEESARFTLWRSLEDLKTLLEEAESFGIDTAVGLYQELHWYPKQRRV